MPLPIHFAPLQGYTTAPYRLLHHTVAGGVECYYTPFLRWEDGGVRKKDLRDVAPEANAGVKVVPQVIAANGDEMLHLCDLLLQQGWKRVDLNMGCPFPMQVRAGRGCGLLRTEAHVKEILQVAEKRPELQLSVKMRLGWDCADEALHLLPLLNATPLQHITLHPRLGVQQYKGAVNHEAFAHFLQHCHHPLLYNGDITTVEQIQHLEQYYPTLSGVMIGRGLLTSPLLAKAYSEGRPYTIAEHWHAVEQLHEGLYHHVTTYLQGEAQQLSHLQPFWEYHKENLPKKLYKQLTRCGNLRNYREAYVEFRKMITSLEAN